MTAAFLIILAVIGLIIAIIVYFAGRKAFPAIIIIIMSILVFATGINGYKEIKRDASKYYPLAVQWLEIQNNNNPGTEGKVEVKEIPYSSGENNLSSYSIYCIFYSPDNLKVIVYVELPTSQDNLVMGFNRGSKELDGIHFTPKKTKPVQDLQNKLDPRIYFY